MKKQYSRVLAFVLCVCMMVGFFPFAMPALTSSAESLPDHLIINQAYGNGKNADGAVSHSFVEIYNPTDDAVDVSGWSLQYAENGSSWAKLNLDGEIPANTSFLVRMNGGRTVNTRYEIYYADMEWPIVASNDSYKFALVENQTLLSVYNPASGQGVVDLVGAYNSPATVDYGEGGSGKQGMSKQKSVRRIGFADTDDNNADFEIIDYRSPDKNHPNNNSSGISDAELKEFRPRSLADGAWNAGDTSELPEKPVEITVSFSNPAGLYQSAFDLELNLAADGDINGDIPAGCVIRYTLDGEDPTFESDAYTDPLIMRDRTTDPEVMVQKTNTTSALAMHDTYVRPPLGTVFAGTVVKAQVFSEDGKPISGVHINSYFVSEDISDRYGDLPIISVTTPADYFFDLEKGIYVRGDYENDPNYIYPDNRPEWDGTVWNWDQSWERPVYFEMFDPAKGEGWMNDATISQGMGVRIHGGVSRNSAQKSLRFYARNGLVENLPLHNGASSVSYDLFNGAAKDIYGNSITGDFQRFTLRAHGNDIASAMLRDPLANVLAADLANESLAYRPAIMFLNGEFWGLYELDERYDEYYIAQHYGTSKDDYEILENPSTIGMNESQGTNGQDTLDYFLDLVAELDMITDMNTKAAYDEFAKYVDFKSLIDYTIIKTFIGDNDWVNRTNYNKNRHGNNNEIWRYTGTPTNKPGQDGKYRFLLKDSDMAFLGGLGENGGGEGAGAQGMAFDSISMLTNEFAPQKNHYFFYRLMQNDVFAKKFYDRYVELLGTTFSYDNMAAILDSIAAEMRPVVEEHNARWPYTLSTGAWEGELNSIKAMMAARTSEDPEVSGIAKGLAILGDRVADVEYYDDDPTDDESVVLMGLTRETSTPAEDGDKFSADRGVFKNVSELTIWDNNQKKIIGGPVSTARTPIVFNNAQTLDGWKPASEVGIDNAPAFEIKFKTTGYENIRFSCTQKSTGSGPDAFRLAYRIGSEGGFTAIENSLVNPVRIGDDTYGALQPTYNMFALPEEIEDKEEVYLRVYFDGPTALIKNGNTSINNIVISGEGEEPPAEGNAPIIINQVYGGGNADGAISHSFIELYNTTDAPINLDGWSLQLVGEGTNKIATGNDWQILPLTGIIPAHTSYLIRGNGNADGGPITFARYAIGDELGLDYDQYWNIFISNRAYKIALVYSTEKLTENNPAANPLVADLVGATNSAPGDVVDGYKTNPIDNISKQKSIVRKERFNKGAASDNSNDYEIVQYSTVSLEKIEEVRPRSLADGAWGNGGGEPPVTGDGSLPNHIIINQAAGIGDIDTDTTNKAIEYSFVELYNPTNETVSLAGWSLQYAANGDEWDKIDFPNGAQILPRRSYLIRANDQNIPGTKLFLPDFDLLWENQIIDNTVFKFALVNNQNLLTIYNPTAANGVVDLVGANNSAVADWYEGKGPVGKMSKQQAARRINFSDYDENWYDFESADYRDNGAAGKDIPTYRPRWSGDGAWGLDLVPPPPPPKSDGTIAFSAPAGIYANEFNLTLSSTTSGATIKYTLDGSDPTNDSEAYYAASMIPMKKRIATTGTEEPHMLLWNEHTTGPRNEMPPYNRSEIGELFRGTVVKAQLFDDETGDPRSDIYVSSYFVNENIAALYGDLPVISVSTPSDNLFDENYGIYVKGPNENGPFNFDQKGSEWERPVYMEIFDPASGSGWETNAALSQGLGLRLHGGASKHFPQKSLRFYARSGSLSTNNGIMPIISGKNSVDYDLFDSKATAWNAGVANQGFKRFMLRAGGNDSGSSFLRDSATSVLASGAAIETQAYRPAVLFINGEFWGMYELLERFDDEYLAQYYGGASGDYRVLENPTSKGKTSLDDNDEDSIAYYESKIDIVDAIADMNTPEAYGILEGIVDMNSLIDYVIIETLGGNTDWVSFSGEWESDFGYFVYNGNNQRMWYYAKPDDGLPGHDGKFRWMLYDTDKNWGYPEGAIKISDTATYPDNLYFFNKLIQNNQFRADFYNRFMDALDTWLDLGVMTDTVTTLANQIEKAMAQHRIRWPYSLNESGWKAEVKYIKDWMAERVDPNGEFMQELETYAPNDNIAEVLEDIYVAAYIGEKNFLPAKVAVQYSGGLVGYESVIWDYSPLENAEAYELVTVTGTVFGSVKKAKAYVEVIPDNLVVFIDAGTMGTYDWTYHTESDDVRDNLDGSPAYDAIKKRLNSNKQALYNEASDKMYDDTWGIVEGTYQFPAVDGDRRDVKLASGYVGYDDWDEYTDNERNIEYKITLPAGTYEITTGHYCWWSLMYDDEGEPNGGWPRTWQLYYGDVPCDVGEITFEDLGDNIVITNTYEHAGGELSIKVTHVEGDGAVLSFIGITNEDGNGFEDEIVGIVGGNQIYAAAVRGGINTLPATVTIEYLGGSTETANVTWDYAPLASAKDYETIRISGAVEGTDIEMTATLEIVPENLVYFIDAGTASYPIAFPEWWDYGYGQMLYVTGTAPDISHEDWRPEPNSPSQAFDSIKALFGNKLKNNVSDQLYSGYGGWGVEEEGILFPVAYADEPLDKKLSSGYVCTGNDKNEDDQRYLEYKLYLQKGDYKISTGHFCWWSLTQDELTGEPNGGFPRYMEILVNDEVYVEKFGYSEFGQSDVFTFDYSQEADGEINIKVKWIEGDGQVISFIGVEDLTEREITNDAVSVLTPTYYAAAYLGETVSLPDTVEVLFEQGDIENVSVDWDLNPLSGAKEYEAIALTGTVGDTSLTATAIIEIIPENLVYFIDAGTIGDYDGGTSHVISDDWRENSENTDRSDLYGSPAYDAIMAKSGTLRNGVSDKYFDGDQMGWGIAEDTNGDFFQGANVDDRPHDRKLASGYVGYDDDGRFPDKPFEDFAVEYRVYLPAGIYEITTGHYCWWSLMYNEETGEPNGGYPRTMQVSYNGDLQGEAFTFDSIGDSKIITETYEHSDGGLLSIKTEWIEGDAPVLSFIGVEYLGEIDDGAPEYTVTFDSDGGSAVAPQTVKEGKTAKKPADPTNDGYSFLGWFEENEENAFDFTMPIMSDLTLTAHWKEIENGEIVEILGETEFKLAAYIGEEDFLPETAAVRYESGNTGTAAISWDLDPFENAEAFATIELIGTVAGTSFTVSATVEVIPEDLVYFIDAGTVGVYPEIQNPGTGVTVAEKDGEGNITYTSGEGNVGSEQYDLIAAKAAADNKPLKNGVSDQLYDGENSWGLTPEAYQFPVAYYDTNNLKLTTGYVGWDFRSSYMDGRNIYIEYTLDLPAGEYKITTGHYCWWSLTYTDPEIYPEPDGGFPRTMEVQFNGIAVGNPFTFSEFGDNDTLSYNYKQAEDGKMTVRVITTGGDGAVLSFIGVQRLGDYEPDDDTYHIVTFDANNGTAPSAKMVLKGNLVEQPENPAQPIKMEPEIPDQTFMGWYDESDELFDFDMPIMANLTLTAKWQDGDIPVLVGISVEAEPDKMTYDVGDALDLTGLVVIAEYSDGTSEEVTGYTTNPAESAILSTAGTQTVTISYTEGFATKTAGFDVTVNAVAKTYTVTFDPDNGDEPTDLTVEEGQAAEEPDEPEKDGYIFLGWYDESEELFDFDTPITENLTLTAKWAVKNPAALIINQFTGTGSNPNGAVQYSFVEIYNPTDGDVDLAGWSLQYTNSTDPAKGPIVVSEWEILNLAGTIPAKHSFLVRMNGGLDVTDTTLYIPVADLDWNITIVNEAIMFALVAHQIQLSNEDPMADTGIVDFVGATNTNNSTTNWAPKFYEGSGPVAKFSKQQSARRVGFVDTDDNANDFVAVDYRSITPEKLAQMRPRTLADGTWGFYTVTFIDGSEPQTKTVAHGLKIDKSSVEEPEKDGYIFLGWQDGEKPFDFDTPIYEDLILIPIMEEINVTIYHTVTFDPDNGDAVKEVPVEDGETVNKPTDPTKDNYTFQYWYADNANEEFNFATPIEKDITLTAKWTINTYTVTFIDHDGEILKTQYGVEHGTAATAPTDPEREGYTFTGWNTDFTSVTSDMTTQALYEINKYSVVFADHDGKILKTQYGVEHGTAATAPTNPEREGHTFTGWNIDFTSVTSDMTTQALYEINTYTVTFIVDDVEYDKQIVEYGKSAIAPADPTKEEWIFDGWDIDFTNVKEDLEVKATWIGITYHYVTFIVEGKEPDVRKVEEGSTVTAPADPPKDGHTFIGWYDGETKFDFETLITEDLTLTAEWTINTYTVTFIDHDGEILKTQSVEYGTAATAPADPERDGHTFTGWNTDFTSVTDDITVTALYETNYYTVTFKVDDEEYDTQSVEYGTAATAPDTDPTKDGYTFIGWYDGETKFDFDKPITADLTLTAEWEKIPVALDKITAKEKAGIDVGEKFITGIEAARKGITTIGDLLKELENDSTDIKIVDINGNEMEDTNAAICTGMVVELWIGEKLCDTKTVVIKFDLTGDGKLGVLDFMIFSKYFGDKKLTDLSELQRLALGVTGDFITDTDAFYDFCEAYAQQ